jgi:hypothetical protein
MTFLFSRRSPSDEEPFYIISIISFYEKTDKVKAFETSCIYIYPILSGYGAGYYLIVVNALL